MHKPTTLSRLWRAAAAAGLPALTPARGAANFRSGELPLPPEWGKEQGLELAALLRGVG